MKKTVCHFLTLLLLFSFAFINTQAQGEKLQFGLNMPYNHAEFVKMVHDNADYSKFFNDYHIQYIRFPGGTIARNFIYYSADLSNQARKMILDYYINVGMMEHKAGAEPNFKFPDDYYEKFVQFCAKNKVKPIITLSTNYYAYNNKVYQIAPFRAQLRKAKGKGGAPAPKMDLGENLRKYLTTQIQLTHKYLDKVTWEIGNEEHLMYEAETEIQIVNFYVNLIKSLYPQDEVIASFHNAFMGEKGNRESKDEWNRAIATGLSKQGLLQKIDYFAPHFYLDEDVVDKTDADIQRRINNLDFAGFEKHAAAYFPSNYKPKFFYTEFAVYLGLPDVNPNFNSNLHAMMLFYYMMNFYGGSNLGGVIYHSFLGKSPFVFVESNAKAFNNNIAKSSPYPNIAVIPIQAEAIKIFYQNVGDKLVNFKRDGNLRILITQNSDGKPIYFIMNPSAQDITIEKQRIVTALQDDTELTFTNFYFQNLNSKSNIPSEDISKKKYKDFSSMSVKKYSVLIVK